MPTHLQRLHAMEVNEQIHTPGRLVFVIIGQAAGWAK